MPHVEVLQVGSSPQATFAEAIYIQGRAKQADLKLQAHLGSCLWPSLPCGSQCLGCLLPQLMTPCQQWHPAAAMQEQVTGARSTQPSPATDHADAGIPSQLQAGPQQRCIAKLLHSGTTSSSRSHRELHNCQLTMWTDRDQRAILAPPGSCRQSRAVDMG